MKLNEEKEKAQWQISPILARLKIVPRRFATYCYIVQGIIIVSSYK